MKRQRSSRPFWLTRPGWSAWSATALLIALLAVLFVAPASGAEGRLTGQKICLDPGHGGGDPGAVNEAFGLYESEINLDVSYALGALLAADGAVVEMTRYDDTYLTNRDRYEFCNGEQATLLISVHTNSYTDASWDGSTTLWSKREDKALALAIHTVLYPELRASAPDPATFRDFGLTKFQSGVLLKSDMPAAMMEPLFMSHPVEAAWLVQPIYETLGGGMSGGCADLSCRRGQIVQAIYHGILSYCESLPAPEPTPTPEPDGTMHVAAIDLSYSKKGLNVFVNTEVTIVDADGEVVAGATVSLETSLPDGSADSGTGITGEDGIAAFSLRTRQTGTYESEVSGVQKAGWEYDAGANVETTESLDVP